MKVTQLDHLVLTVSDIAQSLRFYVDVLGMRKISFGEGRIALCFGQQKINLHLKGEEIKPHAGQVGVGSADLCLLVDVPLDAVLAQLKKHKVPVVLGPVKRTGAMGPIHSVYVRDPDQNLIELSVY